MASARYEFPIRCFRLKSSPAKKTLRLRSFFFIAARGSIKPRSGHAHNANYGEGAPKEAAQACAPRSREGTVWDPRGPMPRARRGSTANRGWGSDPRACGRCRWLRAPGTRRNAFARAERGVLDAGHVRVPGKRIGGALRANREAQRGSSLGKRVLDPCRVALAPRGRPRIRPLLPRTRARRRRPRPPGGRPTRHTPRGQGRWSGLSVTSVSSGCS